MSRKSKPNQIIINDNYAEIVIESRKYGILKTKIDIEDIDKIKNHHWFSKYDSHTKGFYIRSWGVPKNEKMIGLHRLIMDCQKGMIVDHLNHNPLDNRKSNLRICTIQENNQNLSISIKNKSGIVGVQWNKQVSKWQARIKINRKTIFLGHFADINKATEARHNAEKIYFSHLKTAS